VIDDYKSCIVNLISFTCICIRWS